MDGIDQPETKMGDVIIRHNEKAPSVWVVCAVNYDGDVAGTGPQVFTGKREAIERARSIVFRPDGRIYVRIEDGEWYEVA
jgi:hypothetical protein